MPKGQKMMLRYCLAGFSSAGVCVVAVGWWKTQEGGREGGIYFSVFISAWHLVLNTSHQQDGRDGTPDMAHGVLPGSRTDGEIIQ